MNCNIKMMSINAQSLCNHATRIALQNLLNDHQIDVVFLCETWFKEQHYAVFSGYNIFRKDGGGRGSGLALLIKRKFEARAVANLLHTRTFESMAMELLHDNGTKSTLVAVHKKPDAAFNVVEWDNLVHSIPLSNRLIFGGDFNCHNTKWRSTHKSMNGARLEDWADMNGLEIFSSKFPTRGNAFLDLFLVKGEMTVAEPQRFLATMAFDSDHNVIVMNCKMRAKPQRPKEIVVFDWKSADLPRFTGILENLVEQMDVSETAHLSIEQTEAGLECLNTAFLCAMDETVKTKRVNPVYETNVSKETMLLITTLRSWRNEKLHLEKRNATGCCAALIADLKQRINLLAKIVRDRVAIDRRDEFTKKCKKIKNGSNMFSDLKRVSNYGRYHEMPEMMDVGNRLTADKREQVESFGRTLQEVHEVAAARMNVVEVLAAKTRMQAKYGSSDPIRLFSSNISVFDRFEDDANVRITVREVNDIFEKLNNKCSSGWDRIPNKLLKKTGPIFRKTLAILLNHLYNLGHTPRAWKFALVSPLLKAGKPSKDVKSYRPISLLSNLAKIWERCLLRRLDQFYEDKRLIPHTQYG